MEHRRRAADYSHSIESFLDDASHCGTVVDAGAQESGSLMQVNSGSSSSNKPNSGQNKLNLKLTSDCETSGSFKSTILAGHTDSDTEMISESSYKTAKSGGTAGGEVRSPNVSSESCLRIEAPSLMNRAITPQFSPRPELDLSETSVEPRSSDEVNRNIVSGSEKSSEASRDTNHNLKSAAQNPRHKFQPDTPRTCSVPRNQENSPWSMLNTLDNDLDPSGDKTGKTKAKILRRLSQEFLHSPRTFTDRLVTIIDESNTGYNVEDTSGVDLSRMTKEFRKMCKFIQDESMPEWAPSLCINSTPDNFRYPNKIRNHEIPETIEESQTIEESPTECKTPQSDENERKIYRKTPLNIFKKTFQDNTVVLSPGSPNSTKVFEYWEKHCEGLPNSPNSPFKNRGKPLRRSLSSPEVREKSTESLVLKCEELMRSLDDTSPADLETFDSHQGRGAPDHEIETPALSKAHNFKYSVKDDNIVSQSCVNFPEIDEDDLSNSLLIEKELQRQRCYETALVMQQIEDDAKKSNEAYPKALERHGIDPCTAFMQTITSCMQYKKCISGIRKTSNVKSQKEATSIDSGIDTRSFGRTLYAPTKKTETSSRSQKQNYNKTPNARDQKSGGISTIRSNTNKLGPNMLKTAERNSAATKYLRSENPRKSEKTENRSISPCRNYRFIRPPVKSSPSCNLRTMQNRNHKTPDKKTSVACPLISILPSTPVAGTSKSPSDEQHRVVESRTKTPTLTPGRSKSPGSKIFNRKPSPPIVNSNKDTKISNYEVGKCKSPVFVTKPRSKYFVTPGRTLPEKKMKTTKSYFPSMAADLKEIAAQGMKKSIHCPGIFRTGSQNTVVSPVGLYIRGTDVNLIHNNHERKNEMMLTPDKRIATGEKLKFKLSSQTSTPRDSPKINLRLFDKKESDSDENDENSQEIGIALPTANYCQRSQVHEVNASPNRLCGSRTKGLLDRMQNRVVIRHEAKGFGDYDDREIVRPKVPESSSSSESSPADMSIHVLKSAEKTNFMSRRKF